jgi:hypothetical protein
MGYDSDDILRHRRWFDGGRQIVYTESVVDIGGFPVLLSLLVIIYRIARYNLDTASTLDLFWLPRYEFWAPLVCFWYTFQSRITTTPNPAHYTSLFISMLNSVMVISNRGSLPATTWLSVPPNYISMTFCEGYCLWNLTASSHYHQPKGNTGLHSDSMCY